MVVYSSLFFLWFRSLLRICVDPLEKLKKLTVDDLSELLQNPLTKEKYLELIYKDKYEYSQRTKL